MIHLSFIQERKHCLITTVSVDSILFKSTQARLFLNQDRVVCSFKSLIALSFKQTCFNPIRNEPESNTWDFCRKMGLFPNARA